MRNIPFIFSVDPSLSMVMNGISWQLDRVSSRIMVNSSSFFRTISSSVWMSDKFFHQNSESVGLPFYLFQTLEHSHH
ncbi:9794_t:CDS:2 [Funneliformis geosporum]|nr:9794_t:CDS:2 [Funneliformis geosporum]